MVGEAWDERDGEAGRRNLNTALIHEVFNPPIKLYIKTTWLRIRSLLVSEHR